MNWKPAVRIVAIVIALAFVPVTLATCVASETIPIHETSRRVLDANGHAVSHAKVSVYVPGNTEPVLETYSDEHGAFRLEGLKRGKYRVYIRTERFLTHDYQLLVSGKKVNSVSDVRLRPWHECHDIRVAETPKE